MYFSPIKTSIYVAQIIEYVTWFASYSVKTCIKSEKWFRGAKNLYETSQNEVNLSYKKITNSSAFKKKLRWDKQPKNHDPNNNPN